MSFEQTELAVRQHDRHRCDLKAEIAVAPPSAEVVRLARSAPGGGGAVPVRVVDCSRGGIGISSPVYLPQGCRLTLRMEVPGSGGAASFQASVRVQRASMTDRKPSYYLGTSFEEHGPELEARVARLLEAVRACTPPAGGAAHA